MEDHKQQSNPPSNASSAAGTHRARSHKKSNSRLVWVFSLFFLALIIKVYLSPREGSLNWVTDYEAGIEMSRQQNKPVLLAFYKAGTVFCADMWKDTYTNQNAIEYIEQNFIPILIDVDRQPEIAEKYNITYYPTHYVKPPGKDEIVGTQLGYDPPVYFIAKLKKMLERMDSPPEQVH